MVETTRPFLDPPLVSDGSMCPQLITLQILHYYAFRDSQSEKKLFITCQLSFITMCFNVTILNFYLAKDERRK